MMTIQQAFELAMQHHQAGRLAEAEALYRQILAVQPNHAPALHHLGVIAFQMGNCGAAIELIRRAITIDPTADAYNNLGNALRNNGQLGEAIAAYREAIKFAPHLAQVFHNLGNALKEQHQLDEAMAAYRRAIELNPDSAQAHNDVGIALEEGGQVEDAIAAYCRAIEVKPDYAEAQVNLGLALASRRQLDDALRAFRQACQHNPRLAPAHYNLGVVLTKQMYFAEAVAAFRRAIELKPDYANAHANLGVALCEQAHLDEAILAYRRALQFDPDNAKCLNNLGVALMQDGQFDEASAAYRRVLELEPSLAEAHYNLGNTLKQQGLLDESVSAFQRAVELNPSYADAYNGLGAVQKDRGDLDAAIGAFQKSLQLEPKQALVHSNLIFTLHFTPGATNKTITEEQGRWQQQFGVPNPPIPQLHARKRNPDRRLRIGYVSPDFCNHVAGRNVLPLFRCHDRTSFEICGYSGAKRPDQMTNEFRDHADFWRSTVGLTDEALVELIRQDDIDILVDLSQHTAVNRLSVFARKPAPVQASFAGYPESTGLEAIEYRISDPFLESEPRGENWKVGWKSGSEGQPEQVFLIDSFWCYDPCGIDVAVNALPAQTNGFLTFGCLNNFCKVNEPLLRLWARVLRKVPKSRLVILTGFGSHRQRVLNLLAQEGIAAHQLEFVEFCPRKGYLELYHQLDVALDTIPYNGHTTSLDALWMGLPVVSLTEERPVSRGGLSQLSNLGLSELVAHTEEEYINIAIELANDLPRLGELRKTLRARMEASVLMDAPRFARNIEAAYRAMWRHWCLERASV